MSTGPYTPTSVRFFLRALTGFILVIGLKIAAADPANANNRKRAVIAAGVAGIVIGAAIASQNQKKRTAKRKTSSRKKVTKRRTTRTRKAIARKKTRASRKVVRVAAASVIGDRETVAAVQARLNDLGFDAGPVDGKPGRKTREAIRNYQRSIGAKRTGSLTKNQQANLLRQPDGTKTVTAVPAQTRDPVQKVEDTPSVQVSKKDNMEKFQRDVALMVQESLSALGYDIGPIDGKLEGKTVVAIMSFQQTLNVPQTGRLTGNQIKKLVHAADLMKPKKDQLTAEFETASGPAIENASSLEDDFSDLSDLDTLE